MWWSGWPLQSHSIAADWLAPLLLYKPVKQLLSVSAVLWALAVSLVLAAIGHWIKCLPWFSKLNSCGPHLRLIGIYIILREKMWKKSRSSQYKHTSKHENSKNTADHRIFKTDTDICLSDGPFFLKIQAQDLKNICYVLLCMNSY